MADDAVISHGEALRLIDAQIGGDVYIGVFLPRADPDDPAGRVPFLHRLAPLENPLAPEPPRLQPDVGFYDLGGESLCFAPMAGTIHPCDNGIDFRVAEQVSIRVAWRGSEEVGERDDRGLPAGLRGPRADRQPGDLDRDLEQFFAGGKDAGQGPRGGSDPD